MSTLLALTLLASVGSAQPARADPLPQMRAAYGDLDLSRREHASEFAARVRTAATEHCARYKHLITPTSQGEPAVCRSGMAELAVAALPEPERRAFVRAGGLRQVRGD